MQQVIGSSDYKITAIDANKSVITEGKREFSWVIVIVSAVLL
jgi:hypothetical protein